MLTSRRTFAALTLLAACAPLARAAEHITLRNGFELDCVRREPAANDRIRLYLVGNPTSEKDNYIEVSAASILRTETLPDLPPVTAAAIPTEPAAAPVQLPGLLASAGSLHHIDADLLASVVHAESNGNPRAVSRAGARGLMQLMPSTANDLGVADAFAPADNIGGGSAYLDMLLTRYHDSIPLALAAYNAGPLAVDRYHGIPPFPETRAYVARVIREFNRRKRVSQQVASK